MIGCGFMGRAHSNAYLQVGHFFPREHQPVLDGLLRRVEEKDKLEKFAKAWGYRVDGVRLAKADRTAGHRPDRRLRAQHAAPRHRAGRGRRRQDDRLREAAGDERRRGRGDGGRGREGGRGQHGVVQLPPRARRGPGQADHRRRPHRPALPLPRHVQPGLYHLGRRAAGRPGPAGGWTPRWPAPA